MRFIGLRAKTALICLSLNPKSPILMRFSPIPPLLSQLRLARRASSASSRFSSTLSPPYPNLSDSEHHVNNNHLSFDFNLSKINQTGLLRVLHSAKDDPNLALSFLRHLKQNGVPLTVNAYAALVRILSRWRLDRKLDSLMEAIGEQEEDSNFLLPRVSCALVKSYVGLGMFDEAIDVLYQSKRLGCVPGIKSCNFLMNRLVEFGRTDMVVALFRQLNQLGLSANDYTYAIAVKALCRKRDLDGAARLLEETSSMFAYTTFIEGLCLNDKTEMAFAFIEDLIEADAKALNGDALAFAFGMLVRGFCKEMNAEAAEEVIFRMEEFGIGPDVYACSEVIHRYCKSLELDKALRIVDAMLQKGLRINCVIVSSILHCYCKMGALGESSMWLEALKRFEEFRDMDVYLDEVCYNAAFEALSKLERVEEAMKLLEEMTDKGMVPDVVNYTTLIDGYCLQGRFADALDLFDEMRAKGTEPDVITYNVIAGGLARNGHSEKAVEIYKAMRIEGVEPTAVTHSVIISGLCSAGKIEEAREEAELVFDKMVGRGNLPDLVTYTIMIQTYCRLMELQKANDLLEAMKQRGIKPDLIIYTVLFHGYLRLDREMVCDLRGEAKQIWKELGAACIEPDVKMYTVLMNHHCKIGNVDIATDILYRMIECGLKPDNVTYNVLISACHRKGCTDALVTELSGKDITLPEHLFAVVKRAMKTRRSQYRK
ncbi:LOW QUALITY PROTEIN: hypothetical protein HID58_026098 [Brassica napus]|uniref:Pentatricopeptide repeat-containing protein n=1 Tax=Brassica napus TaxID=3708 RepID=A0ABQ8CN02_BRANA|nr:LOW QUALITY PROTEIN: hypothetical protein HID58_026098 [Brassica napus]